MITDGVRTHAYVRALRKAIKPGSVVLDIGTGTGIFALLACKFGARRVYAIDPSNAIHTAREIAAANGCAALIEFHQAISTEVTLPELADVIVSDLRGILPLYQHHLPAIADARRRMLAPGGVLIPLRDTLWLACVEAEDLYRDVTTPWCENKYGLDMQAARRLVANQWRRCSLKSEQVLTEPQCCGTIDYAARDNPDFNSEVMSVAKRAGTAHGLCVWFDATLAEGIHFSNAPNSPELIYGKAFFPWPKPVTLDVGDAVKVILRANLIGEDYLWRWETRILGRGDSSQVKGHFKQSDFFGEPLSPSALRRQAASHVPALNEEGEIDCLILKMMRDATLLGDIARQLASLYPGKFARWQDALTRVGTLSSKYSR